MAAPAPRILFVIDSADGNGSAKQLRLLAVGLAEHGWQIEICSLRPLAEPQQSLSTTAIRISSAHQQWRVDAAVLWRLRRTIRDFRPDVIHTWSGAANAYGRLAAWAEGHSRVIASERRLFQRRSLLQHCIDRALAKSTRRIVVNSHVLHDALCRQVMDRENLLIVIPNAVPVLEHQIVHVDEDRTAGVAAGMLTTNHRMATNAAVSAGQMPADTVAPLAFATDSTREQARLALARRLRLPDSFRFVAFVSQLTSERRAKDAFWALDLLRVIRPNVHLLVVGEGPQRWRLERYREQIHQRHAIHFLGRCDDVANVLRAAECLWQPCSNVSASNSILEAMACGVPVIAANAGGNREMIEDQRTGWLVKPGDRAAFARQTNLLLDDAERVARVTKAARSHVQQVYSVEQMVRSYLTLYRDAAGF